VNDKLVLPIYFGVWAVLAFAYGYINVEDEKQKKGTDAPASFGAVLFGLWPIGAFFAVILSPLWVPPVLAELGTWLRERGEAKEAVKRVLTYAHMKEKCDNCRHQKHEGDCHED
jgi:hypothetical protein